MLSQRQKQVPNNHGVAWWIKFLICGLIFGAGTWFGHGLASMHYEKLLAQSGELHALECQDQIAGLLDTITLKFCAAWNVSVPPYDKDVAEFIEKGGKDVDTSRDNKVVRDKKPSASK